MNDNFIDLSSDDSVTSNGGVTYTSTPKKNKCYSSDEVIVDTKRKVSLQDDNLNTSPSKVKKEGESSSPSKSKNEQDNAVTEELFDKNNDTIMEFNLTNVRSSIRKKVPLDDEDAVVTTVLTERVTISSPKRTPVVVKKKLPLEDDEPAVLDIGNNIKTALKCDNNDVQLANAPPWWFRFASDIGDDIISKLKKA